MKSWVKQLTRQRGYTDQMVEDANAVIFTFGSYRLGVSVPLLPFPHSRQLLIFYLIVSSMEDLEARSALNE